MSWHLRSHHGHHVGVAALDSEDQLVCYCEARLGLLDTNHPITTIQARSANNFVTIRLGCLRKIVVPFTFYFHSEVYFLPFSRFLLSPVCSNVEVIAFHFNQSLNLFRCIAIGIPSHIALEWMGSEESGQCKMDVILEAQTLQYLIHLMPSNVSISL